MPFDSLCGLYCTHVSSEVQEISKADESSVSAPEIVNIAHKHKSFEPAANIMLQNLLGDDDHYSGG